ncbi:MAG: type II toxin-antitoxin system prevent-host-death family antitoxin [Dolichospermum sp.]
MTQITLAELPQNLQNLLNQAQKTGEPLTIIENGIPFAIISPIKKSKRAVFGAMKIAVKLQEILLSLPQI